MKKTTYIASIIALLAFACTEEDILQTTDILHVTGGVYENARTAFVEEGNVTHTQWISGDLIGLYTNDQVNVPYQAQSSGSTTEFAPYTNTVITQQDGTKVYAYYPYSSGRDINNDNAVLLPYTESLSSDKATSAFLYSDAVINGSELNFSFKHLFAYLKLTVSAQDFRDKFPGEGYTFDDCGLYLRSTEPLSIRQSYFDVKTHLITHKSISNRIIFHCKDLDVNGNGTYTYYIPILPQPEGTAVTLSMYYYQEGNTNLILPNALLSKFAPVGGFLPGHVYSLNSSDDVKPDERHMNALTSFYQATNGSQWTRHDNWLSHRPLNEWFGLNHGGDKFSYVTNLSLFNNNLNGQLPDEFSVLMDQMRYIDLKWNKLYGPIPTSVKQHPNWNTLGWDIVLQNQRQGGGFDLRDSRLYIDDENVTRLTDNSRVSLHNIFHANKLTQIIIGNTNATSIKQTMDESRTNRHLDYLSKGLHTLYFTNIGEGTNVSEHRTLLEETYGEVDGISWCYGRPSLLSSTYSYLFDTNGQLVHISQYVLGQDNTMVSEKEADFLRSYLGEPDTNHPSFRFDHYTSTDYSRDGEVFCIQTATEGKKGIPLILIGEAYTDQHMQSNGKYEQDMKAAAERLFQLEPYRSFRKRFDIYGVKVVSPNAGFADNTVHRINEDDNTVFDYAEKAIDPTTQRVMVAVIYNTDTYVDRSYTRMYYNGDMVAYIMQEYKEPTLIHEVCGHGIAKLLDEYIEPGNENLTLPTNQMNYLDEAASFDWGWGVNVDYRHTPTTIKWAHLLQDSRYNHEDLDIYEGAYLYGHGAYRPSENSMMRYNMEWFNAPSREAIYKAIMTLSEGPDWTYSYEDFVSYDAINRNSSARGMVPLPTQAEIEEFKAHHRPPQIVWGSRKNMPNSKHILVPLR